MKTMWLRTIVLSSALTSLAVTAQEGKLPYDINKPLLVDDQTVCLFHFDEDEGAPADTAAHVSTTNKGVEYASSRVGKPFGNALSFGGDSEDKLIEMNVATHLDHLQALTIDVWVLVNLPRGSRILEGAGIILNTDSYRRFSFQLRLFDKNGKKLPPVTLQTMPKAWEPDLPVHITCSWNAEEKMMRIFIDGVENAVQKTPDNGDCLLFGKRKVIMLGNRAARDRQWHGQIDELRISNVDRSSSETGGGQE